MEDVVSLYLRTKARATGLSSLVEMIPTIERRRLLQEVYESYGTSFRRRKSLVCRNIMSVLTSTEFPVKFADSASVKYSLRSTRLREYIRGRNRRPRDDLLWASLLVALDQDDPCNSQKLLERISVLTQSLQQRLATARDLLQSGYLPEVTDEDLGRILEKLFLSVADEIEMAEVLVKYKKVNKPDPHLSQEGRHRIQSMIEARLKSARFIGSPLHSKRVRELVVNQIEVRLTERNRIRQEDLLRCAAAALHEAKGHGHASGIRIVENYATKVARLATRRTNVRVDSHAETSIEYSIENIVGKT